MAKKAPPSFTWHNPTRVVFGPGALRDLPSQVDGLAGAEARVFLVTGRHNLRGRGTLQRVLDSIDPGRVTLFDRVFPFPTPELVDEGVAACRHSGANIVVAIGGGSPLDVGKAVAILTRHQGAAREYAAGERAIQQSGLPFIAVPTTAGSSSEVTRGCALWDMDSKRHMALNSPLMFPSVAIVDPELSMTMPGSLAAVSGMDAFTSAFESYWSTDAQPLTDALNLEVIKTFSSNLERSCIQGDLESRSWCAWAATMSGIAYSNSSPNACHAVGAPLTLYWGTQHGQAVGITLASFLRWNAPAIAHKLPALWHALEVPDLEAATRRIAQIMERCGLKTRLTDLGLTHGDLDTVLRHMPWRRLATLPRPMGHDDARAVLVDLM